jgi:hypothetical protein
LHLHATGNQGTLVHRTLALIFPPEVANAEPSSARLLGDDLASVTAEEIEKAIKALKPDAEMIELYKKIAGAGPLPSQ